MITDDFGQQIQMSADQFGSTAEDAEDAEDVKPDSVVAGEVALFRG
ncbi:hypothetical protein ABT126_14070 [Streptomyces sp. NPDC002012]